MGIAISLSHSFFVHAKNTVCFIYYNGILQVSLNHNTNDGISVQQVANYYIVRIVPVQQPL